MGQSIAVISRFFVIFFKMTTAAILIFEKFEIFYGLSPVGGQSASSCQISSKSVKRLRRYGDLTVFTMAAVRHLGFWKFNFLTVWALKRPILYNRAKFREYGSIHCCYIAIFVIFQDDDRRHLDF